VEVPEKRTEDSQTFANPDGSFTLEQSSVPVRKWQDGQWTDLDATLVRSGDGAVRPKATAMNMAFSGGGTQPLVALESEGRELKLTWPSPRPAPAVDGDSLTYPSVYPGVDLRINVTKQSFSQVLIVRDRAAAQQPGLQKVELDVSASDLHVQRATGGGIDVVDPLGTAVFTAPKPTMWDSRGDADENPGADRTEEPLEGDTVAAMPVTLAQDSVAVTPVRSVIDDPATVYPIHVDPGFTAGRIARSMINQHYPSTASWGWGGDEGVGYQSFEPWSRKRLLMGFSVSSIAGATVSGAVLSAFETWTASCTAKVVEVWKTARFTDTTTWNNGSGSSIWQQKLSHATVAYGRDGCSPGGYWVPFNVTGAVAPVVSSRGSAVYLGMRAADENDELAWKRFRYDFTLAVTYNFPPTVVNPHTVYPSTGCATSSASYPAIGDLTPVPVVSVTDPDMAKGEKVQVVFQMRRVDQPDPFWQYTTPYLDGGPDVAIRPPDFNVPTLANNVTYAWRARAYDGKVYTAWTIPCLLYIDTSKPPAPDISLETPDPPTLNSPITVKFGPHGDAGVVGYRYAIDDVVPRSALISASSPRASTSANAFGPIVINAWSYDGAGNQSAMSTKLLQIDPTDPIGRWLMNEGTGLSTLSTLSNETLGGPVMNLGPQVAWVEGNKGLPADYAINLEGRQTEGQTTATAASNLVNSSQNFSVTARVKLGHKSNRQVIVGEDNPGRSSFTLGTSEMRLVDNDLDHREVRYMFTVSTSSGPISTISDWIPYDAGDWVHLGGIFNRSTGELELYVNGELQTFEDANGNQSLVKVPGNVSVVDGSGPFRTGLGIDNSATNYYFLGQLDDVYLYGGRIDAGRVQLLKAND
jgi:hypothetical protein